MTKSNLDQIEVIEKSAQLDIEQVDGWDKNAREITDKDYERLKKQIAKLGPYKPIIAEKVNGRFVALGGNMRLKAYRELGYKKVWAIVVKPKDEAQRLELSLSDNDRAGYYVADLLAENLKSVNFENLADYKVDIRIPDTNLAQILDRATEAKQGEDDAPELPVKAKSKPGQMFRLGNHVLLSGDSTNPEDVARLLGKEDMQIMFTDPPYNVDYHGAPGEDREGIENDDMSTVQFYEFLNKAIKNAMPSLRGGIYICMGYSQVHTLLRAFRDAGGHFSTYIIWVKNSFTLGRSDYQHGYEIILYGWPATVKNHYFIEDRTKGDTWRELKEFAISQDNKKTILNFGPFALELDGKVTGRFLVNDGKKIDIWRYNKPARSFMHPTMKPVELVENAIVNSTERGQAVLDLFGGSGTTMIACEKAGRRCFMMEIDPRYVDVIVQRWQDFTGKKAEVLK